VTQPLLRCDQLLIFNAALQTAEKVVIRIRASLQRCRKSLLLNRPFRGCGYDSDFFPLFRRRGEDFEFFATSQKK
jgi:hypothetical protein